jgi:hypothetical protein
VPREIEEVEAIELRQVELGARLRAEEEEEAGSAPLPAGEAGLSTADSKALDEIRSMYRRLPPERLVAMCKAPPRGMEKLFAVLAREIGLDPAQPQAP